MLQPAIQGRGQTGGGAEKPAGLVSLGLRCSQDTQYSRVAQVSRVQDASPFQRREKSCVLHGEAGAEFQLPRKNGWGPRIGFALAAFPSGNLRLRAMWLGLPP